MDSQLGLLNVWTQGDWVTKTVSLLLLAMSLASWIVILMKALDIWKYKKNWPSAAKTSGTAKTWPPAWPAWAVTTAIRFAKRP